MKTKTTYTSYGDKVVVNTMPGSTSDILNSGIYHPVYDKRQNLLMFEEISFNNDEILDLPSPEYSKVVKQMNFFMSSGVREKFKNLKYLYKRGTLLYGAPGTGKSIITSRIAKDAVAQGAIVLFIDEIESLKKAYECLTNTQPDCLLVIVFEEFDRLARNYENDLLIILDGQMQKENVIFLATTNFLEKVPKRLYRPGRLSTTIEVKYPIEEAREFYFSQKLGEDFKDLKEWTKKSDGLSIDELKEIVQSVYILEEDLDETVKRLIDTRSFEEEEEEGY